jgi:hypothetical protein
MQGMAWVAQGTAVLEAGPEEIFSRRLALMQDVLSLVTYVREEPYVPSEICDTMPLHGQMGMRMSEFSASDCMTVARERS